MALEVTLLQGHCFLGHHAVCSQHNLTGSERLNVISAQLYNLAADSIATGSIITRIARTIMACVVRDTVLEVTYTQYGWYCIQIVCRPPRLS